MKYVKDDEGEYIDTEERCLDDEAIMICFADGFGSCDIEIQGGIMTWHQLDKLKLAIIEGESRWRKTNKTGARK